MSEWGYTTNTHSAAVCVAHARIFVLMLLAKQLSTGVCEWYGMHVACVREWVGGGVGTYTACI